MKNKNFSKLLLVVWFLIFKIFITNSYSAVITMSLNTDGVRIYTDDWITEQVKDQWGRPTGTQRKLHIKITGPNSFSKGQSSKFTIELEPSDPQNEYIHNFNIDIVTTDGYLKCSPTASYKVSNDGSLNYTKITDMNEAQRRNYKWASALSELAVNAIPVIGTFYDISQNLSKTCDWLKSEENDWVSQWNYIKNYDQFTIPKPICSQPTELGRRYLIECPVEVLSDIGMISIVVRDVTIYPINTQNGPLSEGVVFPLKTYRIKESPKNSSNLSKTISLDEKQGDIILNCQKHILNIKVSYKVTQNGMLRLIIKPKCKDARDAVRLEDINMSIVIGKEKGTINGLPTYYDYNGQKVQWESEKHKLGSDALMNWISMIYSPQSTIEKVLIRGKKPEKIYSLTKTVGNIWSSFTDETETLSFSDLQKQMWKNENIQNTFNLPSFSNRPAWIEIPKSDQGFNIEIPIASTEETLDSYYLLLNCKINGKSYINPDKLIPDGSEWNKEIGLQISLSDAKIAFSGTTGTFTDSRDEKVYKWVKIGSQIWMAENLAFKAQTGCFAYGDNASLVTKYGYLYDLKTAKEVCPLGWHLPGDIDWDILIKSLGIPDESHLIDGVDAGSQLKSTAGWRDSGNGTNSSGFNAIPSGAGDAGSWIDTDEEISVPIKYPIGETACWWTSGMWAMGYKYMLLTLDNLLIGQPAWPDNRYSVRCVSNSTDVITESTDKKDIEDQIIELMGDEITISSEYPTKRKGVKFQYLDLNDDGIDELIVWNLSMCGAQNCPIAIWQTNPIKKISSVEYWGDNVRVLGTIYSGFKDVAIDYYVSGQAYDPSLRGKYYYLHWDNIKYRYIEGKATNIDNIITAQSSETKKVSVKVTDSYNSPLKSITVFLINGTKVHKLMTDNLGEVIFDVFPKQILKIAALDLSGQSNFGVIARRDYTEMLSNLRLKLPRYPFSASESAAMLDELVSVILDAPDIIEALAKLKEAQSSGILIPYPGAKLGAPGVFSVTPTIKDGKPGFILDGVLVNYLKNNLNCKSIRYGINYCSANSSY